MPKPLVTANQPSAAVVYVSLTPLSNHANHSIVSVLWHRQVMDIDVRGNWSRDLNPYIDSLLDMTRLELVRLADALVVWGLLHTDQERFRSEVMRLEKDLTAGLDPFTSG